MAGEALTANEYIKHHLVNLTFGKIPEGYEHAGSWGFAHSAQQAKDMALWPFTLTPCSGRSFWAPSSC